MLSFLMQIFYSQHILHLCCYTGTVCTSPQWLSQNLDSGFSRRLLHIRNLDLRKGQVMLKRRLDCSLRSQEGHLESQRECTEINSFTTQTVFVHPRSHGIETQGSERKCRCIFKSVLQKVSFIWARCRHNEKAITTGTCIWFA